MHVKASCHCQRVRFEVESPHPCPFNRCYFSICRKTAGGGGYAINLGALWEFLKVEGREHVRVYRAEIEGRRSSGERHYQDFPDESLGVARTPRPGALMQAGVASPTDDLSA